MIMYGLWEGIECFVPTNKITICSGLEVSQNQGDVIEDYCSALGENYDIVNISSEKQNGKERINLRVIKGVWVLVM